jgi:hypothetical protein
MQVAFIYGDKLSSKLTRAFTGSTCYHVAFTDGRHMWDMHLIRRRRVWPQYDPANVILRDLPHGVDVTRDYLEHMLETDTNRYGVIDYIRFGFRPLYHLIGRSTPNAGGIICSEMVADDMQRGGWTVHFPEVPSPADLEVVLLGRRNAIRNA